jgi:Carboxypeptidase regulatory-like domain/Membrane-bound lysozyme-inhibitor of c-type lysozyme
VETWEIIRHQVAIAGRVTDAQTGRAIGGARVGITAAPAAFTDWLAIRKTQYGVHWAAMVERPDQTGTAADGHFHFLDLPDGQYTLTASLPGSGSRYSTAGRHATVSRDAQGTITTAAADIALPPTTLKGEITDQDGARVALVEVRVQGSGERAFSDAQGRYVLAGLEMGQRTVLVFAQGYRPGFQTVMLSPAGSVQTINMVLVPLTP